jgi:hypothetical protein
MARAERGRMYLKVCGGLCMSEREGLPATLVAWARLGRLAVPLSRLMWR